ncbi:MAG: hypothetical protein GY943_17320 [Chloroflexi bacterium]|nr:hypothetical protein [Chloroflexota bacterium]
MYTTNVFTILELVGEATSRDYPSTVHGAYLFGQREANHIVNQ